MKTDSKIRLSAVAAILFLSCLFGIEYLPAEQTKRDLDSIRTAQPGSHPFSIHDTDKNGLLNREEYRIFVEHFELRRRANGQTRHRYPPPLSFEEIDTDEDGYLTEDEVISSVNKRLQRHRRFRRYQGGQWR